MSTKHLQTPKVQATMQQVGAIMADRLAPLFKPDALVTVIVRFPDNDEADFFMSDRQETIAALRRFLDRCDKRDELDCTNGVSEPNRQEDSAKS
jgi:hypothetical protein